MGSKSHIGILKMQESDLGHVQGKVSLGLHEILDTMVIKPKTVCHPVKV